MFKGLGPGFAEFARIGRTFRENTLWHFVVLYSSRPAEL